LEKTIQYIVVNVAAAEGSPIDAAICKQEVKAVGMAGAPLSTCRRRGLSGGRQAVEIFKAADSKFT
jgi:hypothetical protein